MTMLYQIPVIMRCFIKGLQCFKTNELCTKILRKYFLVLLNTIRCVRYTCSERTKDLLYDDFDLQSVPL